MSGFNLPPGVSVRDIPGNRPEDEAWERILEHLHEAIQLSIEYGFVDDDVVEALKEEWTALLKDGGPPYDAASRTGMYD